MNPNLGILLKIAATIAFALMIACIKYTPSIPVGEIVFFRSLFAIPPIALFFAYQGSLKNALTTQNPIGHIKRTAAGGTAMVLWFIAINKLALPEALAISYATPIITMLLASLILGEKLRFYRWSAAVFGLVGVLIILWPRLTTTISETTSSETLGAITAFASAFFIAIAMIQIRQMSGKESTESIISYFTLSLTIAGAISLLFDWQTPSLYETLFLIGSGIFGGVGQILLTTSYRYAETSTIAPFEYASMLWGLAIGYFLFDEIPTTIVIVGASIVIASGLFIIYREHQLGLKRGKARPIQSQQN